MAHGLEVRVPFCDYRVVEYAYNIPWAMKSFNGREKGLVRHAMTGILPDDVLWRKKSPYPKTHNPDYLELLSRRLRSVLDRDDCRLVEVVSADKLREMLDSGGAKLHQELVRSADDPAADLRVYAPDRVLAEGIRRRDSVSVDKLRRWWYNRNTG